MKKSDYFLKSFLNAAGVFIYTGAIAYFLFNGQKIFGNVKSFLLPLFMLLLLVISASITGLLVLGKPIHLYLNNQKKDAFALLFSTLGWLIFFAFIVVLIILNR